MTGQLLGKNNNLVQSNAISIEARGLTKRFPAATAINDISFTIEHGEVVGLLGPNGAGKSTTMRILCGILPASAGYAAVCGIPVALQSRDVKRHIGYMPENNPLPHHLRVEEYLNLRARLKDISPGNIAERINSVMAICDLEYTARHKIISTLSRGYRQRVGIAEVLLAEPEVIIMDEPTIGLDPHQVLAFRDLIQNLHKRRTIVISSHILAELELYCDRIIIINQGHRIADGSPEALRREFIQREVFHLEVAGDPENIRQHLKQIDASMVVNVMGRPDRDGFMKVSFTTDVGPASVVGERTLAQLVQGFDIRVRACYPHQASLEEVFLAATRRDWRKKTAE